MKRTIILSLFLFLTASGLVFGKKFIDRKEENSFQRKLSLGTEVKIGFTKEDSPAVLNIAEFEETEEWDGDGELDFLDFEEGKSSLSLSSLNGIRSRATLDLKKELIIPRDGVLKFFLKDETASNNFEEFNLILVDGKNNCDYRYSVEGSNSGWHLVSFSIDKLKSFSDSKACKANDKVLSLSVNRIIFEIISKPRTIATINLDHFWLETNKEYLESWSFLKPLFISLVKDKNGKISLLFNGIYEGAAVLKNIENFRDGLWLLKITPLKPGFFGLFARGDYKTGFGYYFGMDSIGNGEWRFTKLSKVGLTADWTVLSRGRIAGYKVQKDIPCWLKMILNKDEITLYFSQDGKEFLSLGQTSDKTFKKGGLGVAAFGAKILVDEIIYKKM